MTKSTGGLVNSTGIRMHRQENRGGGRSTAGPARGEAIPPSRRQRDTLDFVIAYMDEHGVAPSRTEIARALGVKTSTVDSHLSALSRKSWIELKPNQARYIRLLRHNTQVVRAGSIGEEDMLGEGRIIDELPSAVALCFDPKPDCWLVMHDESMSAAGVRTGDLVGVRVATSTPASGEIVVVRTDGQITLRRIRRIDEREVDLSTETRQGVNIEQVVRLKHSDVKIEGVMVGALIGPRPMPVDERDRGR